MRTARILRPSLPGLRRCCSESPVEPTRNSTENALEEEAVHLFYLTSRGLGEPAAKSLVIEGFLEALVERLAEGPVRDEISAALESRLAEIL
jgi:hypothetical protein